MSRPRLHETLQLLFEQRDLGLLNQCLNHPDFEDFIQKHQLKLPPEALVHALTHTSFAHEYEVPHQELLEFLGDSVLQLILTQELFVRFPHEDEGKLSKMRSTLVNEKSLAQIARALGLSSLLLVGKGEFKKVLPQQDTVLADSLEAMLGQMYRHMGFAPTQDVFLRWLETASPTVWQMENFESADPKSKLQEKSLALYKKLPAYTAEAEGDKFLVKLWLNDELVASGTFSSKKSGEKELASDVLKKGII